MKYIHYLLFFRTIFVIIIAFDRLSKVIYFEAFVMCMLHMVALRNNLFLIFILVFLTRTVKAFHINTRLFGKCRLQYYQLINTSLNIGHRKDRLLYKNKQRPSYLFPP